MIVDDPSRAQASLPALAIALLILSSVTVLSLAVADGALAAADREPGERHVASSLADRFVAASGPVAVRANVLDNRTLRDLSAATLRDRFPVVDDEAVQVTVGGRPIITSSDVRGGTTVRRIVVVRRVERRTLTPDPGPNAAITLPRRTEHVELTLDPPNGTVVRTVRANGRVLLANASGLEGRFELDLSRFETARIRFTGPGPLRAGDVTMSYPVERTSRSTLAVTVDG